MHNARLLYIANMWSYKFKYYKLKCFKFINYFMIPKLKFSGIII